MIDEIINKQVEEFRKKFCTEEEMICECGHHPDNHFWSGDGNSYGGYDSCRVEGCNCVYDESKITTKEVVIPNESQEAHLRSSMLKVGEAVRKEVTKTRDKLVDLYIKEHGRSIPNELADLALKVTLTDKGE